MTKTPTHQADTTTSTLLPRTPVRPSAPSPPHTSLTLFLHRQIPTNASHPRRIDLRPARTHGTRIPAPDLRQEAGQDGAVGADGGGQRLRRQPAAIRARLAVRPRRALTLSVWVSRARPAASRLPFTTGNEEVNATCVWYRGILGFSFVLGEEGNLEKTSASAIYTHTYTHHVQSSRESRGAMLGGGHGEKKKG